MIPQSRDLLSQSESTENNEVLPTKTYKIDFASKRIIGMIEGKDAVIQFIKKVFSTDKYAFEIYNWYYGNELFRLVGQPYDYVTTRTPNVFKEALMVDDRIIDVRDFTFRRIRLDAIQVSCVVDTVYGQLDYEQEVLI